MVEVYIDVIFLVNVIFDYVLLLLTRRILRTCGGGFFVLLGALAGGVGSCLMLVMDMGGISRFFFGYVLLAFVVVGLGLRSLRPGLLLKGIGVFYALAFLVGGILRWLYENVRWVEVYGYRMLTLFGVLLFAGLFLYKAIGLVRSHIEGRRNFLDVKLCVGDREVDLVGLMDTGNGLCDPFSGKPVVVAEESVLEELGVCVWRRGARLIPFHSLGKSHGVLKGFVADGLWIGGADEMREVKHVVVGVYEGRLSRRGGYRMILHPEL